jgi:hypothetical protein
MPELVGILLSYGISLAVGFALAALELKLVKYAMREVRIQIFARWACWSLLAVEPLVVFLITLPDEFDHPDFYRFMAIAAPVSSILLIINLGIISTFPLCSQEINIYFGIFIRLFQLISMIWFLIFGAQFSS